MSDHRGVAEPIDPKPMQGMADALRRLNVAPHTAEQIRETHEQAATMLELQLDWLVEQHRMIADLQHQLGHP